MSVIREVTRGVWRGRAAVVVLVLFGLVTEAAAAEPIVASRGLSGVVVHDASAGRVRAKPDLPLDSPIVVRVSGPDGAGKQEIEFLGTVAGEFDLRDYLVLDDGTPLSASVSIPVRIVSHLPAGPDTDVARIERASLELRRSYLTAAIVLGVVWVLVPVVVLVRRAMKRRGGAEPVMAAAAPTAAEEIERLIAESRQRPLSVSEQGRLELLIMQLLQGEGLVERGSAITLGELAARLGELRTRAECRELVLALEAWLHQRPGVGSEGRAEAAASALAAFQRDRLARVASAAGEAAR